MKHSIKSADFRKLSPERQEEAVGKLARAATATPNGEARDLEMQIQAYEKQFGVSSEQLRRELAQGKRHESWDVCKWLMLLDQRDLLGARSARAH